MADDLVQRIQALAPEELARLVQQIGQRQPTVALRPLERNTPFFELSFAQQRLWFLNQLVPGSSAYTIPVALRMRGDLSIPALEQSLSEIVRRHEVLRTTFLALNDQPRQVITPARRLSLAPLNLESLSPGEREARVSQFVQEEISRPFDLARGPLLRASLLRLGPEEHVFLLTMHHITSDGWSIGVLVQELATLYEAFLANRPSPLPNLPIQYIDFAQWQRAWLQGSVLEEHLGYWRRQLADAPLTLDLPSDHPRPAVQTFRGAKYFFNLEKTLLDQVKRLSQQEQVTLFMTLLTGFKILLARYTGYEKIIVGSAIANRTQVEIENLIGFFVNILLLSTDLGGRPSVRQALQRVKEVTAGAYNHQALPFEKIVEELHPSRDMSRMPLCQVSFLLQNAPRPEIRLTGLVLTPVEIPHNTAKFDLTLDTTELPTGLACCFEYSSDLFEEPTIKRLAEHWRNLLEAMVANPEQSIHELAMLSEAEQRMVGEFWSRSHPPAPVTQALALAEAQEQPFVHRLFEEQVRQRPTALAVVCDSQQLSYQELNQRANQLARYLQERGVGPEARVGICLEKSLDMVVAVLGVLKAGGAYVPLDPGYPVERLQYLLADAGLALLITCQPLLDRLPPLVLQVVCLDSERSALARLPAENLESRVLPANLCYVIYTSGSTGRPKGVLIQHRGLLNLCLAQIQQFRLTPESRVWQFASFSFDASVSELFTTLGAGATLYLSSQESLLPGPEMATLLRRAAITTITCSPSTLAVLPEEALASVQTLISAGEPCTPDVIARWAPGRAFLNAYGPTEGTVCATITTCRAPASTVPIGRPIANVAVYVLDESLRLVPIGVPGELYIGGLGLARGYHQQPALTAARFVPHPFSDEPGARLYRTGDRVRWLASGELEYIGRLDQQVKVRGFRIELGEIENMLSQVPLIQDAVVVAQGESTADRYLTAYLVPVSDGQASLLAEEAAREQMTEWQMLFDETFAIAQRPADPTFDISGWNSSYTGLPLPAEDMSAWIESTIARLQTLQPRRVLEIGCGSGLLLHRLLACCEHYIGTDFSGRVLALLRAQLERTGDLSKVTLLERGADDFTDFPPGSLDTIILNSVIQYFPSVEYLLTVLERALALLQVGGQIFIGDVRNLLLLDTFLSDVELARSPADLAPLLVRERVEQRLSQEQELLLDPAFFLALPARLPAISHVQILLKQGRENELTRFRYDVVLSVGPRAVRSPALPAPHWQDWQADGYSLEVLLHTLQTKQPAALVLTGIPNRRTLQAAHATYLLQSIPEQFATLAELSQEAGRVTQTLAPVDPEALWQLGQEHQYLVELSWSPGKRDGSFDAVFRRQDSPWANQPLQAVDQRPSEQTWSQYANLPLEGRLKQRLIAHTQAYLKARLPEYMIPSMYLVLASLPLSPHGKVDIKALPRPRRSRQAARYLAPQSDIELKISALWQEVLQVNQVGMDDNFFDLGGHSLLLAQLHSLLNKSFEKEISLISLFQYPTVRTQARYFHQETRTTNSREQGRSRAQNRRSLVERQLQRRSEPRSTTR